MRNDFLSNPARRKETRRDSVDNSACIGGQAGTNGDYDCNGHAMVANPIIHLLKFMHERPHRLLPTGLCDSRSRSAQN